MRVYLDHAATTAMDREVAEAMAPYFSGVFGNPSSLHSFGREALSVVDECRITIAELLHAKPSEIYFTSGGSESDNWALRGVAYANKDRGKHIITTSIEHPAVLESAKKLEREGFAVTYLPVDERGRVDPRAVEEAIRPDTVLVSVMFANNEIGTVQPIEEIGAICRKKGVAFHTDAVQAIGSEEIDVGRQNIDLLSFSAHKFYGPKGVGVLYVKSGVKIDKLILGGSQERGYRAGTTDVSRVVGMAKALEKAVKDREKNGAFLSSLRDHFEKEVLANIPFCSINGDVTNRLAGNSNVTFECADGKSILIGLDLLGVAVSTGSACTSGDVEPSHVLLACGSGKQRAKCSVRFSFGIDNDLSQVDYAIDALKKVVTNVRKTSDLFLRMSSEKKRV